MYSTKISQIFNRSQNYLSREHHHFSHKYTYSISILNVNISMVFNKNLDNVCMAFSGCNVQSSPLMKRKKQSHYKNIST